MNLLRLVPTIIIKYFIRSIHMFYCLLFPLNKNKVTFASYRSNKIKDNLAFVNREIRENYPSIKRKLLFKKFESTLKGKIKYIFHMIRACYHLATSKYFIIDDYYYPIYVIKPRKGIEIIQLWHSAGAFKKFGYSTIGKSFGPSKEYLKHIPIHSNYSKVYVSSTEVIPYFAEAFNMPKEKIYPFGIPRTDYFYSDYELNGLIKKLYESYPELKGKILLLYAPTFRGKSHYQEKFEIPFNISLLQEYLGDSHALLIHLHPYMVYKELDTIHQDFIYMMKNEFPIQELLVLSDILITDYSTVVFDYSLLNKPMIFYAYDLEIYTKERDFYYEYQSLVPGPIVDETMSLIDIIKQRKYNYHQIEVFKDRFFKYQDGKSTKRIVGHIFHS
ncbi:MAG: CDP-glycerol glycerophosphotransferase family protein [Bacillota bacterium]|uniref:CDP-glycerol glycerophosphotransferase family protein n=1 Tax=unclassified Virgibacillus TaxID=2620237 RepID=UPI000EF45785|nr:MULTISPECIES: CDP-glycerol glycerophosphotransferase family protein [unclassified Virgibacillus]MCC2248682.1 CDP-glycerol glycerophosphotransferase family protein [Virgibacillus sp. AGTR]MDY7044974.1 CDP-glycerol glycerophosphotransferase family protein [Virgibacillus sp. M23]QRZ18438.1 CDP-glycerol glycerophosphotransferase family protein [Virgibacillus sp. AGTR]